jgi:5-methylcytosine-specific restriction endonuclease McrA
LPKGTPLKYKIIFCSDCGSETDQKVWHQKRCASCAKVANAAGAREHFRAWKKRARNSGVRCTRCETATGKPGMCDKCKAYVAAWKRSNKDRVKAHRRSRLDLEVVGSMSGDIAKRLYALQRGRCVYCRQKLGGSYHLDHIMPLALGGTHTNDNAQLACAKCNISKGAKHPVDFANRIGLLI